MVLLYYSIPGVKEKCSIGIHSDNVYDKNGIFSNNNNSQVESTPTVTLNLGDSRELNYYLRYSPVSLTSSKIGTWVQDKIKVQTKVMQSGSVHVLHPHDEIPFQTSAPGDLCWCQLQHGNVKLSKGKFSVAMVFREVSNIQKYDNNCKMIPTLEMMEHNNIEDSERSALGDANDLVKIKEKINVCFKRMQNEW